jgi:methenyltetrahydromethanopterin cyclohydrolase
MRALACKEPLFERLGYRERAAKGVGVLECRKAPSEAAIESVASACGIDATNLSLLYAPTGSLAGALQVVARSVETALHKLAELDFDLSRIVSAIGTAPLPPVSRDDLAMIGRTNDAILYGARVLLFVRGDDEHLSETGPRVPSCASSDHGAPFIEIFKRYNNDFYAVDPHLFSPAEVTFQNLDTGYVHRFGRIEPDILKRSFALEARR